MSEPLLKVENLVQHFPVSRTYTVKAVNGVSFNIYPGETYGLVGESGSGKTTIGRSIIRLYNPTDGRITFNGKVISGVLDRDTRSMLRSDMQMIFQDPMASLNPRKKVGDIISEGMDIHHRFANRQEREEKISEMLKKVGLSPEHAARYPHQFSGGQRQRIGVARAVASNPKLIIADEPVSALDLSVQAQVLNYMKKIQKDLGISYMFISHDLGVVYHMCDNLAIMHRGKFVEIGSRDDIYNHPQHIYTKRLLAAIPQVDVEHRDEHRAYRKQVEKEFTENQDKWYDKDGKVYDLRQISETHWVALPDAGEEK